ncbi:hypothetical protein [Weissella confusa]|uniref:hypothetical protein n=2 Tax=Weissella confusa TaxID=1583 RepID=UPI0010806D68|nr:hypothetical protein [Weissella confusa]TGE53594.1 hypothetical protein C6P18_02385 [Weissella confusa]TGE61009.1 hypothetical protein C6P19_02375 [Weissella confusa]
MHEELFSQLLYMAKQSNITITEVAGGDNDPDVAFCKERIININRKYKSNISLVIRLAHEITHITFSSPSFLYTFSPYIKNKEERITNERAIRIVAKLFYGDTPNEFRNWVNFMNEFNLPSWFEPLVKDAIYD